MNYRLIGVSIISAMMLQGCIGATVVAGAAAVTNTATDPRTVGTQVDDTTLQLRVNNALGKDQQLAKEARINATAYKGEVLLTGQAPTEELQLAAQDAVSAVQGVKMVYNEIRIGNPVGFGTISHDTWLTTKIRSQLLTSDLVKSTDIKVITENGEVFLLGIVTHRQANIAAEIVSKIDGVKRVIKAFHYLD